MCCLALDFILNSTQTSHLDEFFWAAHSTPTCRIRALPLEERYRWLELYLLLVEYARLVRNGHPGVHGGRFSLPRASRSDHIEELLYISLCLKSPLLLRLRS